MKTKVTFILQHGKNIPWDKYTEQTKESYYETKSEEAYNNSLQFVEQVKRDWHCAEFEITDTDIEEVD